MLERPVAGGGLECFLGIQPDGPLPQPKVTEISPRFAAMQLVELPGPVQSSYHWATLAEGRVLANQ